jgi:pyruvate dehydrogenase E2 component (dihydrolipoamide acetyltransferase)
MARAFKLPDLGEGVHEGEVLAVHVSVGQEVKEGDIILEVETDILVKPGDTVNVGDVMMTFSNGEEAEAVEVEKHEDLPSEAVETEKAVFPPEAGKRKGPIPASPATRRLARELGVDLHQVTPTGSGGLVTADDVRAFAETGKEMVEAPVAAEVIPAEAPAVSIPSPPSQGNRQTDGNRLVTDTACHQPRPGGHHQAGSFSPETQGGNPGQGRSFNDDGICPKSSCHRA